jgi:Ni/Fe-hydrogenase subunit HybB-like protein
MDWKQEALTRIDALAQKLGIAVTYLWHALIKNSYVEGVQYGLFALVFFALAAFAATRDIEWLDDGEARGFAWFGRSAVTWACIVAATACIVACVGRFINPEFYALQTLLEQVGLKK